MVDVLTMGELLVEFMPEKRGQSLAEAKFFRGAFVSGAPGIYINQVAKMGVSSAIISTVGDDRFGMKIIDRLAHDGVDTSLITRSKSLPTSLAFQESDGEAGRTFIFHISNAAASLIDRSPTTDRYAASCRYFHIMGSFLSNHKSIRAVLDTMEKVKASGGKISFDPNIRREIIERDGGIYENDIRQALYNCMYACDIFLPSQADLEYLAPGLTPEQVARGMIEKHPNLMVVLKLGKNGAVYFDRNHLTITPQNSACFTAVEVDPTGAGDIFGGAFVAAILRGYPPLRALEIAAGAGALSVGHYGPMEGTVGLDAIEKFIGRGRDRGLQPPLSP